MRSRLLVAALALTVLSGCAAGVDVRPLLDDFDRYDRDFQTRQTDPDAVPSLEVARRERAEAGALVDAGKDKDALPFAEKALADARLAQEEDRMNAAARRADACRMQRTQGQARWDEALFLLEQTEEFAGKKANVKRTLPVAPSGFAMLPATTLEGDGPATAADAREQWQRWSEAAVEQGVPAADVQNEFERSHSLTQGEKADAATVAHHTYLAGRAVQALESRVRTAVHEEACASAAGEIGALADARADALRATLDLERGLQQGLQQELNQLRAEAKSRQDELYDSLSQLEGKFATIHREARGTIVSLADILFDFDKATLRREVEFNLVKIATILNQFGEMGILIEGHTDSIGTEEYNLELSGRRANVVFDFLKSQDVAESRMQWKGYGESRPVAENDTDEERQRNRRVDLVIQDG